MQYSLLLPTLLILSMTNCNQLLHEIEKTKQLIDLYQRKLDILVQMANKQNISIPQSKQVQPILPHSTIFKQQQQLIKQMNYSLSQNAIYMPPSYILNGTTLIDITSKMQKYGFNGTIVSVEPYQLTIKVSNDKIIVKTMNIALTNIMGKWHRATIFQDMFLQANLSTLILTSQKEVRTHTFKSQILDVYTINQYKILFVTRYQFGYLNAKSLQVTDQSNFQSITESSYFTDGVLFVLLKSRKLLVISQQKIIAQQKFQSGLLKDDAQIAYLGNNYLFVSYPQQKCFTIFEIAAPNYLLSLYKQICLPKNIHLNAPFNYQFFKRGPNFRLLLSNQIDSKMFQITLVQKQANTQRIIPWKFLLIIICIIAVVYFKSKRSNPQQQIPFESVNQGRVRMPPPAKTLRKQKINPNAGQQYIKNLTNQIRRNKNGQPNLGKKQN